MLETQNTIIAGNSKPPILKLSNQTKKSPTPHFKEINKEQKKKGRGLQFADFGVLAGENIVTGGHASIGGDRTVIGSRDRNAGPAYTYPNTFMICNKKLKEIYLSRSLPPHKHRAHEHKNPSTLPFVTYVVHGLTCHHM